MGFVERPDDECEAESPGATGSASTTNTSVIDEDHKQNPIGFIWPKEEAE